MEDNKNFREYLKNSVYEKYICQFLVAAAAICLFFVIYRFSYISVWIKKVMNILQPINIGLVVAYLINPVVRYWEKKVINVIERINNKKKYIKKVHSIARGVSIGMTLTMTIAIIVGLFSIVVPELFRSVSSLIREVPDKMEQFNQWFADISAQYELDNEGIAKMVYDLSAYIEDWFVTDFSALINKVAVPLTSGIVSVLGVFFNSLIGIIVSAYVLAGKERFARMFKKLLFAMLRKESAEAVIESLRLSDKVFGGFISGKIIDSLIIGLLCFIFMSIMDMPYTLLVSVVIGVTNVIPFFGPYFGGVPSAILILIENPVKGIYFIVFIVILQQFDGNILGPKIIGESTGLTAFWVVFAILLFGGLFGMAGLLAGVPTFAVIYGFVKEMVENRLKAKGIQIEE